MAGKSKLATAAGAIKRSLIGATAAAPKMVQMPQAVHEIHVSPDEFIPAGTVITDEIADLAGLDDEEIGRLEESGAIKMVDVYAAALEPAAEPTSEPKA